MSSWRLWNKSIRAGYQVSAAAIVLCAGACAPGPFGRSADDYARGVALSRLREAPASRLDRYKRPADAQPAPRVGDSQNAPETLDLTLEQARALALEHNLDLRVALIEPTIAAQRVSEEEARFESAFTLSAAYADSESPTASTLAAAEFKQARAAPGLRVRTRTGGTIDLTAPMERRETNNSFTFLNPAYEADLALSISHPLLRNAGRRAATSALRIAGYEQQASEARTKLAVLRELASVDRAYWALARARLEVEVRRQQLELARAQLERARRRVEAGAASEIEVTRAEEGVAQRVEAVIVSENAVLLRQRELKRIVRAPGVGIDSRTIISTTTPHDPVAYEFDTPTLIAQALDNRMELLEIELQLAADAVRQQLDRNQLLPLANLTYSYRWNGLGDSLSNAGEEVIETRYQEWALGLEAEVPLGNEAAKSRLRQSILRRLARLQTREARRDTITREVLDAVDQLDTGWQRILAARQSVAASARTLQGEQRQFDVQRSTSTDVLDAAARLAEAQLAEARALTDYQVAQVDLAFATGTLLGAAKVRWVPHAPPDIDMRDPEAALPSRLSDQAEH